jgi:hypothetical protein
MRRPIRSNAPMVDGRFDVDALAAGEVWWTAVCDRCGFRDRIALVESLADVVSAQRERATDPVKTGAEYDFALLLAVCRGWSVDRPVPAEPERLHCVDCQEMDRG